MFLPNQIFNSLRIVHTNEIWQNNEYKHCNISVYDADSNVLISEGNDILTFSGKPYNIDCLKNVEGFRCYGAKFKMPERTYSNCLEITVI